MITIEREIEPEILKRSDLKVGMKVRVVRDVIDAHNHLGREGEVTKVYPESASSEYDALVRFDEMREGHSRTWWVSAKAVEII
jgi:hypothetical protein